jgi:hypothetical protein
MAASCIYREDPTRVTASRNQLGLSIKHVLDTDSCSKNKPQKLGADLQGFRLDFGGSFTCMSCARALLLATPRLAREVSKCARVFLHLSSPPHSQIHIEQLLFK